MIEELREALKRRLTTQKGYASSYTIERQIMALLVLKYLCDQGQESYPELIKNGNIEHWSYTIDEYIFIVNNLLTSFLALIQYENLEDLVKEYLNSHKLRPNIINKEAPKLAICSSFTEATYDILGNTIYIIDKFNTSTNGLFSFKFYDLVLGNNNQYLSYDKIDFTNYNYLYFYNHHIKYYFIRNNENDGFDLINSILHKNSQIEILLDTDYSKISVIKNASLMLDKIAKIILFNDNTAYIYFNNLAKDKISIINWSNDDITKLDQIMKLNRKQKDVLVKVTPKEIRENNYRIGFKLYETRLENENKSINELVDENTALVNRLANLNKDIELELNQLINR